MGDEHEVYGRQIANLHSRLSQSLKHKKPAREIWIDYYVFPSDLQEKTGVANESHAHLAICYQDWLVRFSASGSHGRAPHQLPELTGAFAHCGTLDCLSEHGKVLVLSR